MSSSTVDKIKEKLDIVQVVGAYLKLEKAGANFKAKCPFHNEKTPSFFVSPSRASYYCFGCGAKGDIFTFIEEFEGLDFLGSLKVLAERAGVEIVPENREVKNEREKLYSIMEISALFFQMKLMENSEALAYLSKRGLSQKTIKEWRIGYAPDSWKDCLNYLKSKNFKEAEIEKAGMIKKPDEPGSSERFYDRFRGRVMFPIFDSSGRVIAFSGRILRDDGKSAKYLNSPETSLFHKSKVLYGFHKAKNDIRSKDYSILVEGQMDLLMAQQAGFANAVASSGTAFTSEHMEILKRLSSRIILTFDPDEAGMNAALKSAALAMSLGMEVKIASLPEGFDPADLIFKNPKGWVEALKNSKHIVIFVLDKILDKKSDMSAGAGEAGSRTLGKEVRNKVLPFVAEIGSAIEKSHFVAEISAKTGIKDEAIWEDLKKTEKMKVNGNFGVLIIQEPERKNLLRKDSIKRRIIGFIFWQEGAGNKLAETDKLKEKIKKILGEEEFKKVVDEAESLKTELVFEAEAYYDKKENVSKDLEELILNFEEEHLRSEREKIMSEISFAERGKKPTEDLSKKFNLLSKKIEDLKKAAK